MSAQNFHDAPHEGSGASSGDVAVGMARMSLSTPSNGGPGRAQPQQADGRFSPESTRLVQRLQRAEKSAASSRLKLVRSNNYTAYEEEEEHNDATGPPESSASGARAANAASTAQKQSAGGRKSVTSARSGRPHNITSWKTNEFAFRKAAGSVETFFSEGGTELPTLARGLFTEAEVGVASGVEMQDEDGAKEPAQRHRIVVRGYDKFFNQEEMAWTKAAALRKYSSPPYLLTFKENGCIIFVSALTPRSLIVTSKHALGPGGGASRGGDAAAQADASMDTAADDAEGGDSPQQDVSHAEMGSQWLDRHLARAGRTRAALAAELWARNETAVFELCDDSFEEHVLPYEAERAGLYLHGLNANAAHFSTRGMRDVEAFAKEWGFFAVRWLEVGSYDEVQRITDDVAKSGMWHGEPIEGFVVRTHIPRDAPSIEEVLAQSRAGAPAAPPSTPDKRDAPRKKAADQIARPPYAPGQAWFFKVKFDEPYLMYRDWRELTKRMLAERKKWDEQVRALAGGALAEESPAEQPEQNGSASAGIDAAADGEISKSQLKKLAKKANQDARKREALAAKAAEARAEKPAKPAPRQKRAETLAFIDWCYERIYGSPDGKVRPQLDMFQGFTRGKGIIAVRNRFLQFCETPEGKALLAKHGQERARAGAKDAAKLPNADRPFTKTLIVPIAVPGCGKTVLSIALRELFLAQTPPKDIAHFQSDDIKAKRTGPLFLENVEKMLKTHDIVIADRNNHLFQHRDEVAAMVERIEREGFAEDVRQQKRKGRSSQTAQQDVIEKPRIRVVALAWALDALSPNQIFRVCNSHIAVRGQNHQSLRFDEGAPTASPHARGTPKTHEKILWRFLKDMAPLGSARRGEGSEGRGDERFDAQIRLHVDGTLEENLSIFANRIREICGAALQGPPFTKEQMAAALQKAKEYKVEVKKEQADKTLAQPPPRYYAVAVDMDLAAAVRDAVQRATSDEATMASATAFLQQLIGNNRIVKWPHITLAHSRDVLTEKEQAKAAGSAAKGPKQVRWERYQELCKPDAAPVAFKFKMDKLSWDERTMALGVSDVHAEKVPDLAELQQGWRPHVTIGTKSEDIRPFEAGQTLRKAEAGEKGIHLLDLTALQLEGVGHLAGMFD